MNDEAAPALDPIILERAADGTWTHRYGPAPDGYGYGGKTVCCERPAYMSPAETLGMAYNDPAIDDCCATPGVPKPVALPPYSGEHATCRKCGSKAVETKYTQRAESHYGLGPMGYPKEWLGRRCTVCQAKWDESTVPLAETGSNADRLLAAIDTAYSHLAEVGTIAAGVSAEGIAAHVNAARDVLRRAVGDG